MHSLLQCFPPLCCYVFAFNQPKATSFYKCFEFVMDSSFLHLCKNESGGVRKFEAEYC